jgi:succinate dehydrogenase / fumarate reductase cytochrome b subunit
MLVLGIIVCLGLLLHLFNFWWNMMAAELLGIEHAIGAADGFGWIVATFSCPVYVVLYVIWLAAIWFHLTHGVWSALHTMGLSSNTWLPRIKVIGNIVATIVVLMFAAVVVYYLGMCIGAKLA